MENTKNIELIGVECEYQPQYKIDVINFVNAVTDWVFSPDKDLHSTETIASAKLCDAYDIRAWYNDASEMVEVDLAYEEHSTIIELDFCVWDPYEAYGKILTRMSDLCNDRLKEEEVPTFTEEELSKPLDF